MDGVVWGIRFSQLRKTVSIVFAISHMLLIMSETDVDVWIEYLIFNSKNVRSIHQTFICIRFLQDWDFAVVVSHR